MSDGLRCGFQDFPCKKIYFSYTGQVNLTCVQIVEPDSPEVRQFVAQHKGKLPPLPTKLDVKNSSSYDSNITSAVR